VSVGRRSWYSDISSKAEIVLITILSSPASIPVVLSIVYLPILFASLP